MKDRDEPDLQEIPSLGEVERRHIVYVLGKVNFNLSMTSRVLGIDRSTLYSKLRKYGLKPHGQRAARAGGSPPQFGPRMSRT